MRNTLLKRFLNSCSDNRKSAIQNRKLVGFSIIAFVLVVAGAAAEAQQPKKVSRIGYLSSGTQLVSPLVPRRFGWLCMSLVT